MPYKGLKILILLLLRAVYLMAVGVTVFNSVSDQLVL
jgi:hypothetical protein